jgi:hypothetical protein
MYKNPVNALTGHTSWATNTSRELPDLPQLAGHGIADME